MSEETLKKILLTNGYTQQIDKEAVYDYIQKLKSQLEEWKQHLIIAKEMLNLQGSDGNYNYDSYMLGLYNGMEYIIAFFETREPNFKNGKDIEFLNDKNKNQELKKQLSNSHQIENQQKEFIEYLENEIKRLENIEFYIESMQKVAIATHKHNLSKYREIIDGKEYCVEKDENANQINVPHNCKYINLLNEYQNWLAKEKEVVYRDCGHTQKAITKCYDKLVYLRKIYKDDYDIG